MLDWNELVERVTDKYETPGELIDALGLDILDVIEAYQDLILDKARELDIL